MRSAGPLTQPQEMRHSFKKSNPWGKVEIQRSFLRFSKKMNRTKGAAQQSLCTPLAFGGLSVEAK
jgi:hypothetical protein